MACRSPLRPSRPMAGRSRGQRGGRRHDGDPGAAARWASSRLVRGMAWRCGTLPGRCPRTTHPHRRTTHARTHLAVAAVSATAALGLGGAGIAAAHSEDDTPTTVTTPHTTPDEVTDDTTGATDTTTERRRHPTCPAPRASAARR